MDVTIAVATFGATRWQRLAETRAIPSAQAQGRPVISVHGRTLADARNAAANTATTEWLIYLDADDELAPGYADALMAAGGGLRAPAVSFVTDHQATDPVTLAHRDMDRINCCVIGTAVRREQLLDVGGWWDEPAYEDWSLFRRCWLDGATITHTPAAVYRAWITPGSRNQTVRDGGRLITRIRASHDRWAAARAAA